MNWVLRFPDALVPKTWRSMTYATKFFEWMEYTEDLTIGQCEGNNGKIYEGLVLGVAKKGRRQGLGDKLGAKYFFVFSSRSLKNERKIY